MLRMVFIRFERVKGSEGRGDLCVFFLTALQSHVKMAVHYF